MRYWLILEGETDKPDALGPLGDQAVAAIRAAGATAAATLVLDKPVATKAGSVDFATEPVFLRIDITDPPSPVVASARDGAIVALAATAADAMAAVTKSADAAVQAAAAVQAETPTDPTVP